MTNEHITPGDSEMTFSSAAELQPRERRPRVRRVAVIHADGSRFKIVAAPVRLASNHP